MKKVKLFIGISLVSINVFSQGWVGNSTNNSLYSVNSSLGLTPVSIGIGTSSPTEQLHTTEGVRFQGITQSNSMTRILASDVSGKLFWRDASTITTPPNNNFWSLVGNTSTNPGTGVGQNYLGTSDARRLLFATNATERMTILPTGQVGIGNINPTAGLLTVGNGTAGIGAQGNQLYTFKLLGRSVNAVEHLGMFNNDQRTSRSELTISNSGNGRWEDNFVAIMVHGSQFSYQNANNYYLGQDNSGYALINAQSNATANVPLRKFSIGVRSPNIPLSFYTNNVERIFINDAGQTGLATINPTAALHIDCTGILATGTSNIRFENLQQGTGDNLVIDANGYVSRSSIIKEKSASNQTDITLLKEQLNETKKELTKLKNQIEKLLENRNTLFSNSEIDNVLEIVPTPFGNNVKINYSLKHLKSSTVMQVIDANGALLKTYPLNYLKGQIELGDIKLSKGLVLFNIVSNGENIISKKSLKV